MLSLMCRRTMIGDDLTTTMGAKNVSESGEYPPFLFRKNEERGGGGYLIIAGRFDIPKFC